MSEDLGELAGSYRNILRQAVYLLRSMDAEGELSTGHVSTLNMLAAGPLRVSAIARFAGIRVPSATEQVIKLEAAGLVERKPDSTDARAVLVELTGDGRKALDVANTRRTAEVAAALATLSTEERLAVRNAIPAIDKLNAALRT
ncbi:MULTISPECIES: MarR family winged helix-turn-helix transcriptional regulator [unclassified Arthrobacter]|uniref:MarR family winged helix-turn-helix transcriptional regulator n=1 Tax=unclassified Arthrobacter TaxID=235627 RepID=UPI00159E9391|nr:MULTISPECIES: MarR family transcriptional regulator [unclassified Arthrobacter]MCQ9164969.1 MarR family transcriptional regulator [Arthrobacter sp. STN4]NVM97091.1 MarR family transcriptional regulator [Arthrobacter sp. SDTb3-6]